jgi:hypothetical protein
MGLKKMGPKDQLEDKKINRLFLTIEWSKQEERSHRQTRVEHKVMNGEGGFHRAPAPGWRSGSRAAHFFK